MMKTSGASCWSVVLLVLWAAPPLAAQAVGGLSGRVTDESGGVIAGARVEVTGPTSKQATSDSGGAYRITGLAPHRVARLGVARTFQNLALFNGMTVLDNILLGRHVHMRPSVVRTLFYRWLSRADEIKHRAVVEEIIDFLQLESVRDELVDSIPIGLKKRVELARALVAEPSFLVPMNRWPG